MTLFDGLHLAEVVDNNDPDKLGRVQVRPLIEGSGYESSHLPWAKPLLKSSGGSGTHGQSDIPEKDSKVWITYEKFKTRKNPHYIFDATGNNLNIFSKFNDDIKSNIAGQSITAPVSEYPDVKFRLYANGICTGVSSNSTNKEIFVYHPAGSMVFFDKDGKILIKSAGDINIEAGSSTIEEAVLGQKLKTKLDTLISKLLTHTHPSAMGPTGPMLPPELTDITTLQGQLSEILSAKFKHN